jgi:hypothetical protein
MKVMALTDGAMQVAMVVVQAKQEAPAALLVHVSLFMVLLIALKDMPEAPPEMRSFSIETAAQV